jgi:hypothetical protein
MTLWSSRAILGIKSTERVMNGNLYSWVSEKSMGVFFLFRLFRASLFMQYHRRWRVSRSVGTAAAACTIAGTNRIGRLCLGFSCCTKPIARSVVITSFYRSQFHLIALGLVFKKTMIPWLEIRGMILAPQTHTQSRKKRLALAVANVEDIRRPLGWAISISICAGVSGPPVS